MKSSTLKLVLLEMITPTIMNIRVLAKNAASTQNSCKKWATSGLILVFPLPAINNPSVTKPITPDK